MVKPFATGQELENAQAAAMRGAARGFGKHIVLASATVGLAHMFVPQVRAMTPAGKVFLVTAWTVFGSWINGERALADFQDEMRFKQWTQNLQDKQQ